MATTHTLGYPRIGARRELKFALESFWKGQTGAADLLLCAATLRGQAWRRQADAGLGGVAVGDFSFYDHVLDQALRLGVVPRRFGFAAPLSLQQRFELARGNAAQPALEMTKWFDTNYHYLVPELAPDQTFKPDASDLLEAVDEARAQGHRPKPVLLGPVSFLWLSKLRDAHEACHGAGHAACEDHAHTHADHRDQGAAAKLALLGPLVVAYQALLAALGQRGVEWVQIDEPVLALDLDAAWRDAFAHAYRAIKPHGAGAATPRLLLATYFDDVADHAALLREADIDGLHIDLARAPAQLEAFTSGPHAWPSDRVLSLGVIDGRNVWRTDLRAVLDRVEPLHRQLGDKLWLAPSCSLLHVPVALQGETALDAEVVPWLAFADEKLRELNVLARALNHGEASVARELADNAQAMAARRGSPRVTKPVVAKRVQSLTADMIGRARPYAQRVRSQRDRLALPALPTTTIGSFPQTAAIRAARAAYKRREIGALEYLQQMRGATRQAIEAQERLGLDVLVHGEAERNDMVEFFAELLLGFAVSENGWVQSYGSRCVKPPILWGDVLRAEGMTVEMARYAQSLTSKPVKGMLTGPVTLLQWSFVRDDQPRARTARQLALAVRDEVADLQKAGIGIVQIDEPAFREGLPLKRRDQAPYLDWAVEAFRLAAGGADDATQIHTHMCYCEFGDVLDAIAALDADVITIETSRSAMALLDDFARFDYPNEIGPGVYDIHSPRVPAVDEMLHLLQRAVGVVAPERLWVNPDCGLKTRGWSETEAALVNMVEAARLMRQRLGEVAV